MMKKTVFTAFALSCLVALGVPAAQAAISLSATPSSQTAAAGGTFTVTLSLSVTQGSMPGNVAGYDTVFEAQATQNGVSLNNLFTISNATPPPSQPSWATAGPGFPDPLTLTGTDHAGYAQSADEGFVGNGSPAQTVATPIGSLTLATYTFSLDSSLAPGTYSFDTTLLATSPQKDSDVVDSGANPFAVDNGATFQVTVTAAAVPEPSGWLLGGGVCLLGAVAGRRRAAVARS